MNKFISTIIILVSVVMLVGCDQESTNSLPNSSDTNTSIPSNPQEPDTDNPPIVEDGNSLILDYAGAEDLYLTVKAILVKSQFETTEEYESRVNMQLEEIGDVVIRKRAYASYNADTEELTIKNSYIGDLIERSVSFGQASTRSIQKFFPSGQGIQFPRNFTYSVINVDSTTAENIYEGFYTEITFQYRFTSIEIKEYEDRHPTTGAVFADIYALYGEVTNIRVMNEVTGEDY